MSSSQSCSWSDSCSLYSSDSQDTYTLSVEMSTQETPSECGWSCSSSQSSEVSSQDSSSQSSVSSDSSDDSQLDEPQDTQEMEYLEYVEMMSRDPTYN